MSTYKVEVIDSSGRALRDVGNNIPSLRAATEIAEKYLISTPRAIYGISKVVPILTVKRKELPIELEYEYAGDNK